MDVMTGALSGARTSMSRSKQRSPGSIISDISCSLITDNLLRFIDTIVGKIGRIGITGKIGIFGESEKLEI